MQTEARQAYDCSERGGRSVGRRADERVGPKSQWRFGSPIRSASRNSWNWKMEMNGIVVVVVMNLNSLQINGQSAECERAQTNKRPPG